MNASESLRRMMQDATGMYGGRCEVEFGDGTRIRSNGTIVLDCEAEYFEGLSSVNQFRLCWDAVCHEKWHDKLSDLGGKREIHDEFAEEYDDPRAGQVAAQTGNIIEDAFIDHQRGEEFPGMRRSIAMMEDAVISNDELNPPIDDMDKDPAMSAGLVQYLRGGRIKGFKDAHPEAREFLAWAKTKIDEAKETHGIDARADLTREVSREMLDRMDEPVVPDMPDEPTEPGEGDGDPEDGDEEGGGESRTVRVQSDGDESDGDEEQQEEDGEDDDAGGDEEADDEQAGDGSGDSDDEEADDDDETEESAGDGSSGDEPGGEDGENGSADDERSDDPEQEAKDDLDELDDDPDEAMNKRHGVSADEAYEPSQVDENQHDTLRRRERLPDDDMGRRTRERDALIDDGENERIPEEARDRANRTGVVEDVVEEFKRVRTRVREVADEDGDSVHIPNAIQRRAGDGSVDDYHTRTERIEAGGRAIGVTLDCSGSMQRGSPRPIEQARVALAAVARAAESIGDDFVATTFTENSNVMNMIEPGSENATPEMFTGKHAGAGGKMPAEDIVRDVITGPGEEFRWDHLRVTKPQDGTPTASGLEDVLHLLERTNRDSKLALVVTDGKANVSLEGYVGNSYDVPKQEVRDLAGEARRDGVEVIGVGIGGGVSDAAMRDTFGEDHYIRCGIDELAEELIDLYRSRLNVNL